MSSISFVISQHRWLFCTWLLFIVGPSFYFFCYSSFFYYFAICQIYFAGIFEHKPFLYIFLWIGALTQYFEWLVDKAGKALFDKSIHLNNGILKSAYIVISWGIVDNYKYFRSNWWYWGRSQILKLEFLIIHNFGVC